MMEPFLNKKSKVKLKILGWYQVVGGVFGVLLTFWLLARTEQLNGLLLILYLIAFGLYAYSMYCGKILLTGNYSKGLNLSTINQALQIISFTIFGYGFMYVSGMMLLGEIKAVNGLKLGLNFSLTSTWRISFNSDDGSMEIGLNFFAIYVIYFINKLHTAIKKEKEVYDEVQLVEINPDNDDQHETIL